MTPTTIGGEDPLALRERVLSTLEGDGRTVPFTVACPRGDHRAPFVRNLLMIGVHCADGSPGPCEDEALCEWSFHELAREGGSP